MQSKRASGNGIALGVFAIAFIIGIFVIIAGFDYVPAGNIGVKDKLGIVNEIPVNPGVYWTGILTSTETFTTRIQLREYEASAASKDMQIVNTRIALNFKINPASAPEIYKTIGEDYQDIIITPVIQEAVKSSTAKYTAEQLITERPVVKNAITEYIIEKLENKGLLVTEVSITDFEFSEEFNDAIERKQVAEQDAMTAENKLKEMTFTSQAMKLQEEVIEIKKLDIEMRKLEVQEKWISKWNGVMPNVVMNTNDEDTNFLMQIPTN